MRGFFAALRMTNKGKGQYGDSGCARMTNLKTNAGILRCAQNDKRVEGAVQDWDTHRIASDVGLVRYIGSASFHAALGVACDVANLTAARACGRANEENR